MNGTMVICLSCKRVVWAYDATLGDVRGILNMMKMPCRLCGSPGNFDSWRVAAVTIRKGGMGAWETMRGIADANGYEWANSPDCTWFTEPGVVVSVRQFNYNEQVEQQP